MRYLFSFLMIMALSSTFTGDARAQEAGGAEVFDEGPSGDAPSSAPADPLPLDDALDGQAYSVSTSHSQALPAVQQVKPPEELLAPVDSDQEGDGAQGPITYSIYEGSSSSAQSFTGATQHLASPGEGKVFRAKDPRKKKSDPLARPAPPAAIALEQGLGGQELTLEKKKDDEDQTSSLTKGKK
ncbi:MAG: hypothetical protein H2057_05530 [Alphaproteobacteria bacterium]|nr:hypothetical protein [Alphaproteobacteria bacterium]